MILRTRRSRRRAATSVSPLPALLVTTVRSLAPWSSRAWVSSTGMPEFPKPPMSTVAPSRTPSTAAASDGTRLSSTAPPRTDDGRRGARVAHSGRSVRTPPARVVTSPSSAPGRGCRRRSRRSPGQAHRRLDLEHVQPVAGRLHDHAELAASARRWPPSPRSPAPASSRSRTSSTPEVQPAAVHGADQRVPLGELAAAARRRCSPTVRGVAPAAPRRRSRRARSARPRCDTGLPPAEEKK